MAEQTFRSPNFFEREIDESTRNVNEQIGTPAGVIGTSLRGPAFLPITVTNFSDYVVKFGSLDHRRIAPYAANEFLKHRDALTFIRVLGAGANDTVEDIATTQASGTVKNAGFKVSGTLIPPASPGAGRHLGGVQFIVSNQILTGDELGYPIFSDSGNSTDVKLIRGMLIPSSDTRFLIFPIDTQLAVSNINDTSTADEVEVGTNPLLPSLGKFKIVISSSTPSYGNDDDIPGIRVYSASLNPNDDDYFAKLLNRDPEKFDDYKHLVYADFAVDTELASVQYVGILSGSDAQTFGRFDTRYRAPKTSWFISQPFGKSEYDLFHFESLDDGEYANKLYKISISNIRASLDDSNPYGTFTVLIRSFDDSDTNQNILETFPNCTLNPNDDNYIARIIGDKKIYFNFDAETTSERRFVVEGKYENRSSIVRVVMHSDVENGIIPKKTLPFGFRGVELLKTEDDTLTGVDITDVRNPKLPPVPFRFKLTRGEVNIDSGSFTGQPGPNEITVNSLFWGIKYERNTNPLNSNLTSEKNNLIESYSKFLGIPKLGVLHTGSAADSFNNNKFTLANVAFAESSISELTSSTSEHIRSAAYIRNAQLDTTDYTVQETITTVTPNIQKKRITFGTLVAQTSSVEFNKFTQYAKFTNMMYGGFDGVNILDKNEKRMNDKATSFDAGGGAVTLGPTANAVSSYLAAANIMLNPMMSNINILSVPGIKDPYVTDQIASKVKGYGLALYLMDLPSYDDEGVRLYDDSASKPDVEKTISAFESRAVDNNYVAAYFPDVVINDDINSRRVKVPASVPALAALGLNDRVAYPWFAPAGFNRAALDFVKNVSVRLSVDDRDKLYDARINPIATFPRQGYVIFGQKTLQINKSALDRVNVRRMLLEVKRVITQAASKLVFEQNTQELRNKFINEAGTYIALVQSQQGIEDFKIIMDDTNNSQEDRDMNKLNGRVIVVPTRAVEFISIDFVITNSGITFAS